MNVFAQQGWQCPLCQRIYSPSTIMCYSCQPPKVVTTDNTGDVCTCGTTAICRVHPINPSSSLNKYHEKCECKGHPFNCYGHPHNCGCSPSNPPRSNHE